MSRVTSLRFGNLILKKVVLFYFTKSYDFGMNWSIFQDGFLTPLLNAPSSFMCCIATAAASKRFHKKTDEPYYCLGSLLLLTIPDPPSFQISFLSYPPLLKQIILFKSAIIDTDTIIFSQHIFRLYDWHSLPFFRSSKPFHFWPDI